MLSPYTWHRLFRSEGEQERVKEMKILVKIRVELDALQKASLCIG
jgi:hypothetical protein